MLPMSIAELNSTIVLMFTVIDPLGTVPVFTAVTERHSANERNWIALRAVLIAGAVLMFFIVSGQFLLDAMAVPLDAFQIAGGAILFLFALSMIFGDSKPQQEENLIRSYHETAAFPLAVPSIASPGAIMAVMLLTDGHRFSLPHQLVTIIVMIAILAITFVLMLLSRQIVCAIGTGGMGVISRVMGMLLASVAANNVLAGLSDYFFKG